MERLESRFQELEDYSCEVEQRYFENGEETQRVFLNYHFRKDGRIRIDFSHPQSNTSLFYRKGEAKATVLPIRSVPWLRFRLAVHGVLLKTHTGQRVDQTDMGYFIEFLKRGFAETRRPDFGISRGGETVVFLLWTRDYLRGKDPEKYRIVLSTATGFPLEIERYSEENRPIEKTRIGNYVLNARPGDEFFLP